MFKLFALILLSVPNILFAQQSKAFKINGHSSFYNNKHLFIEGGSLHDEYNNFEFVKNKKDSFLYNEVQVQIKRDHFTINGRLKYPHPFRIQYYDPEINKGISSYIFFLDGGSINIEINDLSKNKNVIPLSNSRLNNEYRLLKKLYSKAVDSITGQLYDMLAKQKVLHDYIAMHPNSYVALWDMALDYVYVKKDEERKSILDNTGLFSAEIKKNQHLPGIGECY